MSEQFYYDGAPGAEEQELRDLGHRIVFTADGSSVNIGGVVVSPSQLVPIE